MTLYAVVSYIYFAVNNKHVEFILVSIKPSVRVIWEIWYIFSREYVQSFYLRANLSISGERWSVTATIPAHKMNRRLAMTPTTKLTPRIWFPSWLKKKIYSLLLYIGVFCNHIKGGLLCNEIHFNYLPFEPASLISRPCLLFLVLYDLPFWEYGFSELSDILDARLESLKLEYIIIKVSRTSLIIMSKFEYFE